jgi:hypothetical protein
MKMQTSLAFAALVLVCFGLFGNALAVNPPPDGGYSEATRQKVRTPF